MNERNTEKDFTVARGEIDRVIERFRELIGREVSNSPENTGLERILQGLKRVEQKRSEQSFQVAVLALAKSGKSTLINALLGAEYLPSSNIPETARIVGIRHEPTEVNESVLGKAGAKIATGVTEIRGKLRELNAVQRKVGSVPAEDNLTLFAPFVCLAERSLGEQRFEILDTPGPNEAGADILREKVDGLLRDADVIIYLLDYTKLKTEEEKCLFTRLSSMRPELLKQCSDRLFFAVNKIDLQDWSGLSLEETRKYVADLLSKQVSGLNVPQERVLLVSAVEGLLARIVESGHAEEKVIHDFAKRAFGVLYENATIEKCRLAAPRMLDKSNLTTLEESIISFIYANRGRLSLQSFIDDLERQQKSFDNYLRITSKSLETTLDDLARKYRKLDSERKVANREFKEITSLVSRAAGDIEQWVEEQFSGFHDAVTQEFKKSPWENMREKDQDVIKQELMKRSEAAAATLRTKFDAFYDDLKHQAWERQIRLFEEIQHKLEPLVQRIEETVGESLNVSLNPVQVQIPAPSIAEFNDTMQGHLEKFIEIQKERQRRLVKKGGSFTDDRYDFLLKTVYSPNSDRLIKAWCEQIKTMTEEAKKTAGGIIKRETRAIIESAKKNIRDYGDLYVQTVGVQLKRAERRETVRGKRLDEVQIASEELLKLKQAIEKCREFLEAEA